MIHLRPANGLPDRGKLSRASCVAIAALCGALVGRPAHSQALGPADGVGLPPSDTGRVRAGMMAPDFTLEAFRGGRVTLSKFRERKNVVLAFYRGHW
jgi:cytochrome oxidase Cu insertion factor (SCO1/SenC/PrrC family)